MPRRLLTDAGRVFAVYVLIMLGAIVALGAVL